MNNFIQGIIPGYINVETFNVLVRLAFGTHASIHQLFIGSINQSFGFLIFVNISIHYVSIFTVNFFGKTAAVRYVALAVVHGPTCWHQKHTPTSVP